MVISYRMENDMTALLVAETVRDVQSVLKSATDAFD